MVNIMSVEFNEPEYGARPKRQLKAARSKENRALLVTIAVIAFAAAATILLVSLPAPEALITIPPERP